MNEKNTKKSISKETIPRLPGIVLKAYRHLKNQTQEKFSNELNISRNFLKNIENNTSAISNDLALDLEKKAGLSYKFLRSGKGFAFAFKDSLKLRKTPINNISEKYKHYFKDWLYYVGKINNIYPKEMAKILNIPERIYNLISTGDKMPEWEDILMFVSHFEIPIDYLTKNPKFYALQIISEHDKRTEALGIDIDDFIDSIDEDFIN